MPAESTTTQPVKLDTDTESQQDALNEFAARLPSLIEAAGHSDIFGIDLSATPFAGPGKLVLAKYLKARNGDVEQAAEALQKTLRWRKEFDPAKAAFEEDHGFKRANGLAYVTKLGDKVVVWNMHAPAAKNPKNIFEPLDAYLRWRVGVQERAVTVLDLSSYAGEGQYDTAYFDKQGIQVHDYQGVSVLRLDPVIKDASKALIPLMTDHYAESMKRTYFVNVPFLLRWLFNAISFMLSNETLSKLKVLSSSTEVAKEIGAEDFVPVAYGGKSELTLAELEEGTMKECRSRQDSMIGPDSAAW